MNRSAWQVLLEMNARSKQIGEKTFFLRWKRAYCYFAAQTTSELLRMTDQASELTDEQANALNYYVWSIARRRAWGMNQSTRLLILATWVNSFTPAPE